jgi:hypothetical protein
MFGVGPLLVIVVAALIFGGFYYWARRQGLVSTEPAAEGKQGTRRISLLTETVAYVGAILLLAGGIAAIGQRWNGIGDWGHVSVFAVATVFFLLVGIIVRRVHEPAVQRLVGVVWFLSLACLRPRAVGVRPRLGGVRVATVRRTSVGDHPLRCHPGPYCAELPVAPFSAVLCTS